jgi:hypothetical protein
VKITCVKTNLLFPVVPFSWNDNSILPLLIPKSLKLPWTPCHFLSHPHNQAINNSHGLYLQNTSRIWLPSPPLLFYLGQLPPSLPWNFVLPPNWSPSSHPCTFTLCSQWAAWEMLLNFVSDHTSFFHWKPFRSSLLCECKLGSLHDLTPCSALLNSSSFHWAILAPSRAFALDFLFPDSHMDGFIASSKPLPDPLCCQTFLTTCLELQLPLLHIKLFASFILPHPAVLNVLSTTSYLQFCLQSPSTVYCLPEALIPLNCVAHRKDSILAN